MLSTGPTATATSRKKATEYYKLPWEYLERGWRRAMRVWSIILAQYKRGWFCSAFCMRGEGSLSTVHWPWLKTSTGFAKSKAICTWIEATPMVNLKSWVFTLHSTVLIWGNSINLYRLEWRTSKSIWCSSRQWKTILSLPKKMQNSLEQYLMRWSLFWSFQNQFRRILRKESINITDLMERIFMINIFY